MGREVKTFRRNATAAGCFAVQDLSAWIIRILINEDMVDIVLETVQPVGKGLYF
ncbi:thiamine biosynthesis protein ThiJ (plasmid) [Bacillus anthracis]|nr:thiamine biosynthesis protein ThiJ [Bacillus anthracis]